MKVTTTEEKKREVEAVTLSDNDVLMLYQTAELNAGGKAASIHQKRVYSALKELLEVRKRAAAIRAFNEAQAKLPITYTQKGWTTVSDPGSQAPPVYISIPNNNTCPKCGQLNFSHPRMGIWHVCPEVKS